MREIGKWNLFLTLEVSMSIVGIDISSTSATFCILGNTGVIAQDNFPLNKTGFNKLLTTPGINKDSTFVMESTGKYHLTCYHYLLNHNMTAYVVNPLLIKQYKATITLRKTKTDKSDALLIAGYANNPSIQLEGRKTELETESKLLSRDRLSNSESLAKAKTRLKGDIAVSFPELLKLDVSTDVLLNLLSVYGSSKQVSSASITQLAKAIRGTRVKSTEHDKSLAKQVKQLAKDSVGVDLHAAITRHQAKTVLYFKKEDKELTKDLVNIEKEIHPQEMEIITSFPGISYTTAAHFMAEVQDIHRFSRYQKLIAFIGTDPTIYQSGNEDRHGRISKRGNKVLRKYCYLMATNSLRSNPVLAEYYSKKREQGFPHRKAMIATTNKLIRAIYALLIRGEKASI